MDIKKLQIFAMIAQNKSISRTAEQTDYSQSGISHMIRALEEELDLNLIIRDRYGVHLTSVGQELLPYVQNLLRESERFDQYVNELHGLEKGRLTIGTFSSVSIHWLPPLLSEFQRVHPHIDISLREGGMDEIERWIVNQEVDLGFYSRQPGHPFQFIPIADDAIMAVLPADYPMDGCRDAFPMKLFDGAPFIMSEMGVDYDVHRVLKDAGVKPNIRFSAKDDHAIMSMVEHHLGISILPELITKNQNYNIRVLPLEPFAVRSLGLGLLDMEKASPITKQFLHFVKSYFGIRKEVLS